MLTQGGHSFLTPEFQDISMTFSGHFCIFQGQLLSCQRHDIQCPYTITSDNCGCGGTVDCLAGPGQSPNGGLGGKAPVSSEDPAV